MAVKQRPTRGGVSRTVYFATIVIVLLIGFVAGTRSNDILGVVGPVLGFKVATGEINLSSVEDTYRQLKAHYDGTLDTQKLIDGASRGLVAAAGDQYTVFMDAEQAEAFEKDLSGQIGGGIGAEIGIRDDQPTVIRVIAGNPAEKAGVKAGDKIVAINDRSTNGWTADEAARSIRGEPGTTVKVVVLRGNEEKDFAITRQTVNNPSVDSRIDNGVGVLVISRFDDNTADLARRAAEDFRAKNVKGVILDLRGNGGGYINAARDVASLWLNNQLVVTERAGGAVTEELRSGNNPVLGGIKTIVLVDSSSASASEIVAGALQDHNAATLLGEKTFGKGSVQKIINLADGKKLKVTIARWYTPNGKNITKDGIAPDKKVELTAEDANAGRDPQLEAAKSQL